MGAHAGNSKSLVAGVGKQDTEPECRGTKSNVGILADRMNVAGRVGAYYK